MKILMATFIPWIIYFCFLLLGEGNIGAQLGVFVSPFVCFFVIDKVMHP